jgi:TonB family protein
MGQVITIIARLLALLIVACGAVPAAEPVWRVQWLTSLEYPRLATLARIEGTVELRCEIAQDGSVKAITVRSGHDLLAKGARTNAMKWRFAKARDSGLESENDFVTLIYVFRLTGTCVKACCPTEFSFQSPNLVTVETAAPHWQP